MLGAELASRTSLLALSKQDDFEKGNKAYVKEESEPIVASGGIDWAFFSRGPESTKRLTRVPSWPMVNSGTKFKQHLEPTGRT
jgi:hypothetical protein